LSIGFFAALMTAIVSASVAPPASAQSAAGRSGAAAAAASDSAPSKQTVESASRDAQRAIRACDDNVAVTCVADELTKYAEALQEIAEERREAAAVPVVRHKRCLSKNRPPGCRE
jgi:hypothetical protein